MTVSQIINHVKCFNAKDMQHRLSRVFEGISRTATRELNKVIEIEYDNNDEDVLFLEIPLSDGCIDRESGEKRHCLWLGRHIAVFAVIGRSRKEMKRRY